MANSIVKNLNDYIIKIEEEILTLKSRNKHFFYDFDVQFMSQAVGENLKRYFLSKKYIVQIDWCQQCKNNVASQIIIQF